MCRIVIGFSVICTTGVSLQSYYAYIECSYISDGKCCLIEHGICWFVVVCCCLLLLFVVVCCCLLLSVCACLSDCHHLLYCAVCLAFWFANWFICMYWTKAFEGKRCGVY